MVKRHTGLKRGLDALLASKTLANKKYAEAESKEAADKNHPQDGDLRTIPVKDVARIPCSSLP